jgi:hypothetical protein
MLGPTASEKRRIFEGHALSGKLSTDALDALLRMRGSSTIQPAARYSPRARPAAA